MSYTPLELAHAFIRTGEVDDALNALNDHLNDNPDDETVLRLRAQVLLRQGGVALSAALDDMTALHNLTADDYALLSVIHERLQDYPAAIKAAQAAFSHSKDERAAERLIDLYTTAGNYGDALTFIQHNNLRDWRWLQREADLLVLLGDDMTATARYGLALAQLEGRFDLAQDATARALAARILIARAHAYRRSGQLDIAAEQYAKAEAYIPGDPAVTFNRGLVAALQGDEIAAREYCGAALSQAPAALRRELLAELDAPDFASLRDKLTRA